MKDFITKMTCIALLFVLCIGSLSAQNEVRTHGGSSNSGPRLSSVEKGRDLSSRDILYSEGFESATGTALPGDWTSEGSAWTTSTGTVPGCQDILTIHGGARAMVRGWQDAGSGNWAFSPAIPLSGGNTYTISFWYQAPGYFGEYDDFEVRMGQTPSSGGMSAATVIFSCLANPTDPFDTWYQAIAEFTPTIAGDYHLAFHDLTPSGEGFWIAIDDIEIEGTIGGGGDYPNINAISLNTVDNDVKINWMPPGYVYEGWLSYCLDDIIGGVGVGATSGATMWAVARFSSSDLLELGIGANNSLTKLDVGLYGGTANITSFELRVWQGGTSLTNPGTLLVNQPVTVSTLSDETWHTIDLNTPLQIDPTKELWIGYGLVNTAGYPLGRDNGGTYVQNYSTVINLNGTWYDINSVMSPAVNWAWSIRGFVTDANGKAIVIDNAKLGNREEEEPATPLKFNVYCNDHLIGSAASNATEFLHKNAVIHGGELEYCVEVVYDDVILEPVCATIDVGDGGIPQQLGCIGTVALNETFETDSPTASAWTMENVIGTTQWTQVAYTGGTPTTTPSGAVGRKARMYYNSAGGGRGATTKYVSPVMDLSTANEAALTFWHTQRLWGTDQDQLRVYYKTSATGSWTMLAEYTGNVADWTQRKIVLPELSAAYYIAFEGTVNYGYGCQLDDIIVLSDVPALPLPETPSNLVKTGDQLNWYNVHLNWEMTTTIGISGYYVYRNGFLLNTAPIDRNTMTYFDVTPGPGTYVYEVQSIDATTGCLSEKATLTVEMLPDPCAAFAITALPYTEGFESSSNILDLCWSQEVMKGHLTWQIVQTGVGEPAGTHTGSRKVRYFYEDQLEQVARLVSPKFNLGGGGGELNFWYTNKKWYLGQDVLRVYYKNSEGGDWILLETYNTDVAAWTEVTLELPDNTTTYWVCFEGNTNQGHGVQLDDIRINGCPRYTAPPLIEGFESAMTPACWTQEVSGSTPWVVVPASGGSPATAHSGSYKAFFDGVASLLGSAKWNSAPIYINNNEYDYLEFSFWHTNTAFLGTNILSVGVKTEETGAWTSQYTFNFATSNAWIRASSYFPKNLDYFQMQFDAQSVLGTGIQLDDIQIIGCDNISIPFEEQFSDGTLPDCWYSEANLTPWKYVTAGTYPNPTGGPHSAGGMLQFNAFSSPYTSGTSGRITTRPIKLSSAADRYVEVSFWMYRDNSGSTYNNEGVNVYVTPTRDVTGATPELFVNRYYAKAPVEATANAWYQYKVVIDATKFSGTAFVTFEGRSAYGYNIYIDDVEIVDYICDDNPVALPIITSFEGDFPEMCWDLTATNSTIKWKQSSATVHDGANSIMADCWTASSGNTTELTTRSFITEGKNQILSFWMYRNSSLSSADRVNIYLTESGSITGVTPLFTINRYIGTTPAVPEDGWYQYFVELPCANMTTAKVTIQAISAWGDDIYVDLVEIGDLCIPVQNIVAEKYGDNPPPPFHNHAMITWDAPVIQTASLTGYNVYRNGTKIGNNVTDLYYDDATDLAKGEYLYCVTAVYDNDCGESEQICAKAIVVIEPCVDTPGPANVSHIKHTDDWYDVDITWEDPIATATLSYCGAPDDGIGTGGANDFEIMIRLTPEMLASYNGKKLTRISFVPNVASCTYYLKVYKGGSDMNPGTQVTEQQLNTSDLIIGQWNTARIGADVTINASQELWVGVRCVPTSGYPAGCDAGPIAVDGSSNLMYFAGEWVTMNEAGGGSLPFNWCIKGHVRLEAGDDEVIGYNVYRDEALLTQNFLSAVHTSYRDRVPGPGTYTYEVSAIYDAHCESGKVETIVEMDQSPCESLFELPIIEGFEGDRFPSWCWETKPFNPAYLTPWKLVTAGTSPTCAPHSGSKMIQYNSYSSPYTSGRKGLMISPKFVSSPDNYTLKFWMYRDAGYASYSNEGVEVYLSETDEPTGTRILFIPRTMSLAPAVTEAGWYEYTVELNTSNMPGGARVILVGVSQYGNNIYVDDISIVNERACDKVENVTVEQPLEGDVLLSWTAPMNPGLTGYRIFRDGIMIANNHPETQILDHVSLGAHEYCIIALFDKPECTESNSVCLVVDVIGQCDPLVSVTAEVIAANKVQVTWTTTGASGVSSFSVYCDGSHVGTTHDAFFIHEDVPSGAHTYSVVVNYDNKPCTMSDAVNAGSIMVESCIPITDLTYEVSEGTVTLDWTFDGKKGMSRAGDVILDESFANGAVPAEWTNLDNDGDGYKWQFTFANSIGQQIPSEGRTDAHSINTASYYNDAGALSPDNWLITPKLQLGPGTVLTYWMKVIDAGYPQEHYGIYVSTSGTNPSDFTSVFEETLDASYADWKQRTVEIPQVGECYIAIRHFDSYDNYVMCLDDIIVESTPYIAVTFDIYKDGVFVANAEGTTWQDTDVQPGTYQYCVRPIYEQCTVDMTCIDVEVEECLLGDVTNLSATQDQEEKPKRVDLTWSYSGEPAEFVIQRTDGIDFEEIGRTMELAYPDETVEYNKAYTYFVQAVKEDCTSGAGDYDNVFVVKPVGIENDPDIALNIYPNPASTSVTIAGGNIVEIEIYNAVGQLVDRIMAIEGETVKQVNVAGYEAGAYVFRLISADQKTVNKSIMVVR